MESTYAAQVGLVPTVVVDVPVCAVLIALFLGLAVSHLILFLRNKRRGKFFIFNVLTFAFGMSRIVACTLRLVWATKPTNSGIAIASEIFLNAGILIVYITNNLFVQRMLRAALPRFGWNPVFRLLYKAALFLFLPMIIMLITVICLEFTRPTPEIIHVAHDILKFALGYLLAIAALPLFFLPVALFWPRSSHIRDDFGEGYWYFKAAVILTTTILATLEAGFRAGTMYAKSRPVSHPAWYDSKAAFFCFGFMLDVIIMMVFLFSRIDKLFWVPNNSNGEGDYTRLAELQRRSDNEHSTQGVRVKGKA